MAYENLKPAADTRGHPITQAQWNRAMALIASWFDSKAESARIAAEARAILAENNHGEVQP